MHPFERGRGLAQAVGEREDYVDIHAWCFAPASFELILFELAMLGETDLWVERTTPAQGCEFFCWLRRGARARMAAMSDAEKADDRLTLLKRSILEMRAQADWLLAGDPALARLTQIPAQNLTDMTFKPATLEGSAEQP